MDLDDFGYCGDGVMDEIGAADEPTAKPEEPFEPETLDEEFELEICAMRWCLKIMTLLTETNFSSRSQEMDF